MLESSKELNLEDKIIKNWDKISEEILKEVYSRYNLNTIDRLVLKEHNFNVNNYVNTDSGNNNDGDKEKNI